MSTEVVAGSVVFGFAACCCGCCFGTQGGALVGWFFGGGGLYTLVAIFPALGMGRELFCCAAFFPFQSIFVVALCWIERLSTVVLGPGSCLAG